MKSGMTTAGNAGLKRLAVAVAAAWSVALPAPGQSFRAGWLVPAYAMSERFEQTQAGEPLPMFVADPDELEEALEDAALTPELEGLRAGVASWGMGRWAGECRVITLPGGVPMEMVWCPPGSFSAGLPEREPGKNRTWDPSLYGPRRAETLELSEGFWLAKHEVTQAQWRSVMGWQRSFHGGSDLPEECVSLADCQRFCARTGLRLPTDAEWEHACRAGLAGPCAGPGYRLEPGLYGGNSANKVHPAGQTQPWARWAHDGEEGEWRPDWQAGNLATCAVTIAWGADAGRYGDSCYSGVRYGRGAAGGYYDRAHYHGFRPVCSALRP
jgi:hypothetical protein